MSVPRLFTQNLSFHYDNANVAFNDISLSFTCQKYGIVGDNGVGKSTLLKILASHIKPEKGAVQQSGELIYLPQSHDEISADTTVATALGIYTHLDALDRVKNGTLYENDFERLDGFWDIQSRVETTLSKLSLWPIDLKTPFHSLSGGQKTKIFLAKAMLFHTDFILMDEPTNNLDKSTREILYKFVDQYKKGIIVVSHDRSLLNLIDEIIEITPLGIKNYGGNFDFYKQQKQVAQDALEKNHAEARQSLKKTKATIQASKEKQERLANRGKKAFQCGHVDKLTARSKQGRSEKTHGKLTVLSEKMMSEKRAILSETASKIQRKIDITGYIEKTAVPRGKNVLSIHSLVFTYNQQHDFIISNFNLSLIGPERIAILGKNGSGKSTILKLILDQLKPTSGDIKVGVKRVVYLDQTVSLLQSDETLLENFFHLNSDAKQFDAYHALAAFMFRNKDAEKKVCELSGGEKIRAGLAITLMSKTPPQLLILDEPTNHLDLSAIQAIEDILQQYQGALIIVSHDENFIKNIEIDRSIELSVTNQ